MRMDSRTQNDWYQIRNDLRTIADIYNLRFNDYGNNGGWGNGRNDRRDDRRDDRNDRRDRRDDRYPY
jgi:hypothetical protein